MAKDGKQESLDRFLTQTPKNNNKRSDPFSPDNISPSLLQVQKQARLNSSPTTPEHPSRLASNSDPPPCSEVQEVQDDTVVQLPHVVCATLQNQNFMDQLLPMISRVSINGLDNVTITVSWNSDIVESQTCSSTVLFLFFNPFLDFVQLVL
jgi:hypothetical protein